MRRADSRVLRDPIEPDRLLDPGELGLGALGEREEVERVAALEVFLLA